nr:glycosyltransferase [Sphingomonadaceae bacterium]
PFDRPPRAAGETSNNYRTLFSFALSGLAGSSRSLLRLPLVLAIYLVLITMLLLIATIVRLALHGYSPLLTGLTIGLGLFSLLLMFVGLIGDQLRILVERSRNVPLVIEDERINFSEARMRPADRTFVAPRNAQ